ncbi:MAG: rhodanese-like domain-containing protein [Deferrisomatales bacterium]|nr:rhodanese-like domain-containing protein [Deferrisomatales bacterium]
MENTHPVRFAVIAVFLVLGAVAALASARQGGEDYPGGRFLATGTWLRAHLNDPNLVVVDVRTDRDFDGRAIPGAVRMPWTLFRYDDPSRGHGDIFVGTVRAQEILGAHGIARTDTVVLYDTAKKDGGALSSYVFWVLDLLGHREMKVLERGLDGWLAAGGETAPEPRTPEPLLYQAPATEIRRSRMVDAAFVQARLGDPYYQILDVRSREEYLGERPSEGLGGEPLRLGHIPTAVNVDYRLHWADSETKALMSYGELQELYRGLDPSKTVITYCHSGRRASFSYFVLRLMGLEDVAMYEASWFEWGNPRTFFPIELEERVLSGERPGTPLRKAEAGRSAPPRPEAAPVRGGYVSCGG